MNGQVWRKIKEIGALNLKNIYLILSFIFLSGAAAIAVGGKACAQIANSACDATYFQALEARAWMEAQREITQNQAIIVKPDSVLEYTCFDQYLNELAGDATFLLSESQRWGPTSQDGMDLALTNLVGGPLLNYLDSNFGHSSLGGTGGNNTNYNGVVRGGSYNCNMMDAIWQEAQCADFTARADFVSFDELQTSDPRQSPSQCAGLSGETWNIKQDQAYKTFAKDNIPQSYAATFTGECRADGFIETGLRLAESQENERICLQAGCYYNTRQRACVSE